MQGVGGGHSGMEAASGVQRGAEEGGGEGGEGGPGGGRGHHAPGGRARRGPHLSLLPAGLQQSR